LVREARAKRVKEIIIIIIIIIIKIKGLVNRSLEMV
jgi:hypothetical protein